MIRSLAFTLILAAGLGGTYGGSLQPSQSQASDSTAVLLAAGDIASCTNGAPATARLLDDQPGQIMVAGDAAYRTSRDPNPYVTCYDSTWGRHKNRTRATLGNHDFEPRHLRQYFDYFGDAAGPRPGGYYSFELGSWHVIALNSNLDTGPRSLQGKWLAADLAAHPAKCTIAVMHHPRFSSGPHAAYWTTRPAFRLLDSAGVDIVLSGHDHIYERFAPMTWEGKPSDTGVRQFVVGTGGSGLYTIGRPEPNSEAHTDGDFGILKLTLKPDGYSWEFLPVRTDSFTDSGSGSCH